MKIIYACFSTSYLHEGHLNIIHEALKYGDLIVGVLSDSALISSDKFSLLNENERLDLIKGIQGVSKAIIQKSVFYDEIIDEINPDYIIHGDNWKNGHLNFVRERLVKKLQNHKCNLIEIKYTVNQDTLKQDQKYQLKLAMPEYRRPRLKKLLTMIPTIRVMEAHNGLTGLIVEKTIVATDKGLEQFDAIWISSLTDSTVKGKPDIELVDMTSRLNTISEIMEVTTKPIILDGDTGGQIEHFVYNIKTLERMGVSAIIIEDKTGLKRNSLFGTDVKQTQEDPDVFAEKIKAGKKTQLTDEFMIIARIESFILGVGIEDALIRSEKYIKAGADGILIHSKSKDGIEIMDFISEFRIRFQDIPLVVVPTTYNHISYLELSELGTNIVIYANHLLRSAYPSMLETTNRILKDGKSEFVEEDLMPINSVLKILDN